MARTHAAGTIKAEYGDAGVVYGKGGEPIPTTPHRGIPTVHPHGAPPVQHMDDGELIAPSPAEPPKPIATRFVFDCGPATWQRALDGYQAMHLFNALMKKLTGVELAVTFTEEEARKLPPDTRWHMRRREVVVEEGEPE